MLLLNLQEHLFFFFCNYWFLMVSSPYSCVLGMAALKMIMRNSWFNLLLPEIFLFPTRPIDLLACIACFSSAIHSYFETGHPHLQNSPVALQRDYNTWTPVSLCGYTGLAPRPSSPDLEQLQWDNSAKIVATLEDDRWWTVLICSHLAIF